MSETTNAPAGLYGALAALQASLPKIGKGETANVRSDKGNYSYKYANLADVSQEVLPRLGSLGLAFVSRPTVQDGQFVLAYSLTHSSGDSLDGVYPLPSNGTPQAIGSAITYARRYCLCAVTGVAPDTDDDDGASAQQAARTAGGAWDTATPARPRQAVNGNGHSNGQAVRPAPAAAPAPASGEPDPDAQQYADEAHEARTLAALQDIQRRARDAHKLAALIRNPATGNVGGLGALIDFHRKRLTEIDAALALLNDVAKKKRTTIGEVEIQLKLITGKGIEEATAAEMRGAAEQMLAEVPA